MASPPLRRKNHYVPRSYLKRWANDSGKVWAYRCLVSRDTVPFWKLVSTRGVAYHEHLYTRIAASGESDEIERWLDAEFESPAQEAIERATSGRRLNSRHWKRLIRFFAAQDVRTPARFMENLKRWESTIPDLLERTLEEGVQRYEAVRRELNDREEKSDGEEHGVEPVEPFPVKLSIERLSNDEGGFVKGEVFAGRGLWLWAIRHQLNCTLEVLEKHDWTILRAPKGISWFTSDDPVLKVKFSSLDDYTFGGGWDSDGTDLLLPLGPQHLLFTQVGRSVPPRDNRMTVAKANVVRSLIAKHAHRFVFATSKDPFVSRVRPRVVNAELWRSEIEQWNRWHAEQTAAERDILK